MSCCNKQKKQSTSIENQVEKLDGNSTITNIVIYVFLCILIILPITWIVMWVLLYKAMFNGKQVSNTDTDSSEPKHTSDSSNTSDI